MTVGINNSCLALDLIPDMQQHLDHVAGGGSRFQIYMGSAPTPRFYLAPDSELSLHFDLSLKRCLSKQEALDWQADPDDDLDELEVLHHLRQKAAAPILSSGISTRSLQEIAFTNTTASTAPPGLDEKAKVKFVKEEARLLLAAMTASSPLHSTPTNSLQIRVQILELSASPRRYPSGHFRSLSQISSPFSCSGPDDAEAAFFQTQQCVNLDSICDISTTGVLTNLETLNSVQNAEQGWNWFKDSSTLAAPPNAVNPSAYKNQSMWLDCLILSPPAPMHWRSPSPSRFQDEIAYALLEQQSLLG